MGLQRPKVTGDAQLWNRDFEGRLFAPCTLDYGSQLHVLGCGSLERKAALMLRMARKTAAAVWAALVTALMILSGYTTEAAPAAKSLKTLVEGLE